MKRENYFSKHYEWVILALVITGFGMLFSNPEAYAVAGDTCTATLIYEDGVYVGCKTCVNGHCQTSGPSGLTEFGCATFCSDLKAETVLGLEL